MNTMFVVMQCIYDYDGNEKYPILVTPNEQEAKNKVLEMEQRLAARQIGYDQLNQNMAQWELTHPRPRLTPPNGAILPSFPGKKNSWTQEQKDIYKKAKKKLDDDRISAAKPYGDWAQERYAEQQRFTLTLGQQVQDDLKNLSRDNVWEIEDVPYIE